MNCPNCGAELRPNARFCTTCGAAVPEPEPAEAPVYEAAPIPEPTVSRPQYQREPESEYVTADPAQERKQKTSLVTVLHHIRAYLAVLCAIATIVMLFLPWVNAAMEVKVNKVVVNGVVTDLQFGNRNAENPVSLLDLVQVRQATDLFPLQIRDNRVAEQMKAEGKTAEQRINEFLGVPASVELKGVSVPTGLLAAAPQLLCVLLMLLCYIIGAIRVFAVEAFPDGAPRTGWLKAGGIIGVIMSVFTALEVLAINQFYTRVLERVSSFDGELVLKLRLLSGFGLFALVCVVLVLLANHWGNNREENEAFE